MQQSKVQLFTSGPLYGVPFTISGDAYKGLPQKVFILRLSSNIFDNPKSAICKYNKDISKIKYIE